MTTPNSNSIDTASGQVPVADETTLRLLQGFVPLRLATTTQLIERCGLTREVVNGALKKMMGEGDKQARRLVREVQAVRVYAGSKGRPSSLYLLESAGAQLLRQSAGGARPNIKACNISDPQAQAHAVCVRDVFFKAQDAGLMPLAERELRFGEDDSIRPDVLLTLPDGSKAIVEVEQEATAQTLARLLEKVRRLSAFFRSDESRGVSSDLRIVFNVSRAKESMTARIWEKAIAAVAAECDERRLPCQFWLCPLQPFLDSADMQSLDGFENLFNPALLKDFAAPSLAKDRALQPAQPLALPPELAGVRAANSGADLTLLRAYLSVYRDLLESQLTPHPDTHTFFQLVMWIYCASHYAGSPTLERAAMPVASLYLLRQYIESPRHPDLKPALRKAVHEATKSYVRGNVMVRDRLTRMAWDVFLRYHGFARGGPLQVFAAMPGFDRGRSEFHFEVSITNEDLLIGPEGVLSEGECELAEEALAWLLEALVVYVNELGIATAPRKGKEKS